VAGAADLPAGRAASGGASGASAGTPSAGSAGAGTTAVNGVTGPANIGGLNNSGNDPSGAGKAAKASNALAPTPPGQLIRQDRHPAPQERQLVRQQSGRRATPQAERREVVLMAP
jgi:hypothetical protein